MLKLSAIDAWSWWRVLLPVGLIVGFNITNIAVAFTYLSFADIPETPGREEADVPEPHTINGHYVAAVLFFVMFGDKVVRWIEGNETSHWFWLLTREIEVLGRAPTTARRCLLPLTVRLSGGSSVAK